MKKMFKKTTTLLSIVAIFLLTIFQSITVPTIVSAAELNQSGFVDSFNLEPTDLNHGESTKISVEFSDKSGNNMKAGDTLTLQVPENLEAYTTPIDLIDESGQKFGTCEFPSTSLVVCTFNDTVEKLENIRGSFFFTAIAGAVEAGTTVDYETNLGTNLAKKGYSITSAAGGTDPGVFFYKTGDLQPSDPDHVRWFLNTNLKKEHLSSDIIIKDEIGDGQTLVEDSFSITIEDHTGQSKTISKEEFIEQQYGQINIIDGQSFDITIYQSMASVTSFNIMYLTKITDEGNKLEKFNNNFITEYTVVNEDPVAESGSHEVKNIFGGSEVEGDEPPAGTVRVVKTLDNNEELPLEGVTFNIFKADGTPVANGQGVVTNAEGIVEIADLAPGNYYAQEISAPDYVDFDPDKKIEFTIESGATEGIELPINNDIKTTDISVTKVWEGISEDFPEITINLLADGEQIDSVNLENGAKEHTFTNLPTHTEQGEKIEYTVTEEVVEGFDSEVTGDVESGFTVTNTKQGTEVKYKDFDVTKSWVDGDGSDRPTSIEVQLIQGEEYVYETATITAENDWKYTFENVPMNDEEGNEFEYTIKELPVPGYATEIDGFDITNTKVGKVDVEGTKNWKDNDAKDRPESITVELFANGEIVDSITVTEETNWTYAFADLDAYDADGNAIEYTIDEVEVPGYATEVNGFDITNTKVGKVDVEGTKTWKDDDAKDRPESITVELFANGEIVDSITVTEETNWTYAFTGLDAYDADGNAIEYTIDEVEVPGYATEVDGFDITNTKVGKVDVEGTKTWKNDDAKDRPESITVELFANGEIVDSITVTEETNWTYAFTGLDAYDADGNAIEYTIDEVEVPGYRTEVNGYDLVNTLIPVDPEEPVEPEEPNKPVVPEEPVEPSEPTEPSKPEVEKENLTKDEEGSRLPSTATNIFNLSLLGFGLMLVGIITLFVRRKTIE